MKKLISTFIFSLLFLASNSLFAQDPIVVNKTDNEIYVQMSMDQDYLAFGYAKADKNSQKLICFSSWTKEVDGNPHKCPLGAFYTSDDFEIKYLGTEGDYIKASADPDGSGNRTFYLEKSAVVFED